MKFKTSWLFVILFALLLSIPGWTRQTKTPTEVKSSPALGFIPPDMAWVRRTLKSLSLRDKVAQLVKIRVSGRFLNHRSPEFLELEDQIRRNHIGGLILFAGNVYESATLLNDLQNISTLPLIVAADFERGASFRIADTTSFPWTMAIGATGSEEFAYREGVITAQESRALGVHWVYAPVVDVNNNPDNPVINIRSYGEDPSLVARLGAAFIRGCREYGVLTTAKHFPGHGDTATDSHIGLAVVQSNQARLDSVELVPFRSAIEAGVDSVMTAHVAVPSITGDSAMPATLSSKILTDLLRNRLQFQGLIVTDALEMGGITTRFWSGQAAIRALQAGADMLLLSPDNDVVINEVVRAIEHGDIPEERINRSVEKILEAKSRLGLQKRRQVALEDLAAFVATPENQKLAQEMADRSMTVVRNEKGLLPINPLGATKVFSLVLSADNDTSPGSIFQNEMQRRFRSLRTLGLDPRVTDEMAARALKNASESDLIVCATLVRVISGSGRIGIPDAHRSIIEKLLALGKPIVWVAFGNPYLLKHYPMVSAYLCTFSYSDVSQVAAAKALSGEIPITGRLPISIPDQAGVGEGLQIARLNLALKEATPESVGVLRDAFADAGKKLAAAVESKSFSGAALMVGYRGNLILNTAAGLTPEAKNPGPFSDSSVVMDSSLAELAETLAAMTLVESGRLLLDSPVQDYLPEFRGPNKDRVVVRHLLHHSSGLALTSRSVEGFRTLLEKACDLPLETEPGSQARENFAERDLLNEILDRVSGRGRMRLLNDHFFRPLGLRSTSYRADALKEPQFTSTATDLAVLAQMLLDGGFYDHRRYLRSETVANFKSAWNSGRSLLNYTSRDGSSFQIDFDKNCFVILVCASSSSGARQLSRSIIESALQAFSSR